MANLNLRPIGRRACAVCREGALVYLRCDWCEQSYHDTCTAWAKRQLIFPVRDATDGIPIHRVCEDCFVHGL